MEVLGYVALLFLLAFLAGAGAGVGATGGQRPAAIAPARSRRRRAARVATPDAAAGIGPDRAVP